MQGSRLEGPPSIGRESFTGIDMPNDIFMLDVSADKTRMAVIYKTEPVEEAAAEQGQGRHMLRLYDLPTEENGKKAEQNEKFTEQDVSFILTSIDPNCIFLSSSGKNGFVALSFVEMSTYGQFRNRSEQFSKCYIYGNSVSPKEIPFQGRAVFMGTKLALIGRDTVDIYGVCANAIKKEYALDTKVLSEGYEATKYHTDIINDLPWAKFIKDGPRKIIPVAAYDIITMSRHICNNILITQHGSNGNGIILRIWSILDGALLTSFKPKNVEHVMAISDNYRYIATYDEDEKTARIYCTKTSVVLHTIPITAQTDIRNGKYTLTYMRFFGDGRYLIISGYKADTEISSEYRKYYFEMWCVPAHKLLLIDEIRVYYKSTISPFAMEFQNRSDKDASTLTTNIKPGRQFNLPEMRAIYTTKNNQNATQITAKTLFKQDWKSPLYYVPQTWKVPSGSSPQEPTKCKITLLKKPRDKNLDGNSKRPELNSPLNEFKKLLCYSIQMGTDYYILRFGYCTVQLWRLKEMNPNASEQDKLDMGFKLEEEGSPYFHQSMEESDLIYIRAYKATNYGTGLSFKEDWNIHIKADVPQVFFMDDTGHIFVEITYPLASYKRNQPTDLNTRELIQTFGRKWPFSKITGAKEKFLYHIMDVEEIFLPISKTLTVSMNSRSSDTDSTNSDFHEIESACRALHYINGIDEPEIIPREGHTELKMFKDKIYKIIRELLESNYFTTISGSETLAMLASFKLGQTVLKDIITTPGIPINIISYTKENNARENVLTVLIENDRDDLFKVFFSRVLTDSYNAGLGNLSAIMDALLHLQYRGTSEFLFNYIKKLSYIPVNFAHHPILKYEHSAKIKIKRIQQDHVPSFRTLENCSAPETLTKYDNTLRDSFLFNFAKFKRNKYTMRLRTVPSALYWLMFGENWTSNSLAQLCVIPLPRFNDYKIQHEENLYNDFGQGSKKAKKYKSQGFFGRNRSDESINSTKENHTFEKNQHQKPNPFTGMTSCSSDNQIFKQGDTVMEVPTQFKWKTFVRTKFFLVLCIHIIYYICYTTAVTFPKELYDYEPGSVPQHPEHFASIALMFLSGFILLLQEFREFRMKKLEYITSFYNWIDLAALALPIAAFSLLLTGNDLLHDVDSVAILILWAHGILRLRVFRQFGFTLEIIIQLSKKVMPIIGIMILVVFAFTHAFIAQLRLFDDEYFQERFQGGATNDDGDPIVNATTYTMYDVSSSNNFSNVFRAFSMVWFFIFGVFDPINDGDVGDNTMTIILAFLFSFITVLIFSNMVIALMSSTIEDVKKLGNRAWYFHFATVVAEIELLWCTSRQRYDRKNNPSYIYYVVDFKTVKNHVESMRAENDELVEELKRGDNHRL